MKMRYTAGLLLILLCLFLLGWVWPKYPSLWKSRDAKLHRTFTDALRREFKGAKYSKNSEIWNGPGCPSTLPAARSAAGLVESGAKVEIYFEVAARRPEIFFCKGSKKDDFPLRNPLNPPLSLHRESFAVSFPGIAAMMSWPDGAGNSPNKSRC